MALADGLVGYWSPWLGSSGYRLLDRSGRGNHGTLTNMDAGTDWIGATVQGRSGYVLDFDGVNNNVQATITTAQQPTVAITMAGWALVRNGVAAQKIFALPWATASLPPPYVSYCLNCGTDTSTLRAGAALALTGAGGDGLIRSRDTSAYNLSANAWNFVVATYDSASFRLYLNGSERDTPITTSGAIRYNSVFTLTFGMNNPVNSFTQDLDGQIAESCIWNRALTASEVRTLYRLGPGWYRPTQPRRYGYVAAGGFKAYWARRQSQLIGGGV